MQPLGQKALTPVEDWITGRGYAHMVMAGIAALNTLFFILYLVGAGMFSAAIGAYDKAWAGLDIFYYIPPLTCWLFTMATLALSRNESTGCIFLCGMPFFHCLNALLMVVIYVIFGFIAVLYDKDTVCGLVAPGTERDNCMAIGSSSGLMSAMIWLLVLTSFFMTIASCMRKSEIMNQQQQVRQMQMAQQPQPVGMVVMQPMMVPAGQVVMQQQPMMQANQGLGGPPAQQQTLQPQGTDVETGVELAVPEPRKSSPWGLEDLNPFLPQKRTVTPRY